jgi:hypothetical protein
MSSDDYVGIEWEWFKNFLDDGGDYYHSMNFPLNEKRLVDFLRAQSISNLLASDFL